MKAVRVGLILGLAVWVWASSALGQTTVVPGTELSQHDFLYAGESHERRIFVVRGGKVVWSYDDPAGRGEISDAVMLSNGNVLFAHQFGVTEISPAKTVVWHYETPPGHEVHTAVPIGKDRVLFLENADSPFVRVVNTANGETERQFPLVVRQPISVHGQFRHARLTIRGTLLVAHMDLNKVVEYDSDGHELWSFPGTGVWGATPLGNGNVLMTDRMGVREVTPRGDTAWSWTPAESPEYKFVNLQQAWRLNNGDTLINNWVNEWTDTPENRPGALQAIEWTPVKKVVWALRQWAPPADLGPATTIQILDGTVPEDVHFGPFH